MTTVGYGDKKIESFGRKVIALIWMFTALLFISGLTASIASTIIKDAGLKSVKDLSSLSESKVGKINSASMVSY